jgi:choloylglycine hydrolase
VTAELPNGARAQLHLSLSDASVVFEYVAGKLIIHHGKQYEVMTNSPTYDQQLSLNDYWRQIGGLVFLPGTKPRGRPVRACFVPDPGDSEEC